MIALHNWKSRAIATPLFKGLCLASYSPAFSTPRNCRFWIIFFATALGRFAYICMASAPDTLPARNWRVGVDVLADALMNASLPEDEWEREREVAPWSGD